MSKHQEISCEQDYFMKKIILTVLISFLSIMASAKGVEEEPGHNRVAINGLLTSQDSYQLEASYHYMISKYAGVGGALGYWKNYSEDGCPRGNYWSISLDDMKPDNFYLRPSVIFKSPAIKIKDAQVGLFAEPGIMLNIPYRRVCLDLTYNWPATDYEYVSTNHGQWCAIDVRLGVFLNCGGFGISAGYMMSNFDIYSQSRHLSYQGQSFEKFYPDDNFMQGAYLSCSYYF